MPVRLIKIANDLRWLASGSRCAIGEIELPDTQPVRRSRRAKSIRFSVNGHQRPLMSSAATRRVRFCCHTGNFELNVTMPVVTLKLLEAIEYTANAINSLTEKCVIGIEANEPRCRELVEKSRAMVTALAPLISYMPRRPLPMKRLQPQDRSEVARLKTARLLRSNSKNLWTRGA